jgi:hypothetical protein
MMRGLFKLDADRKPYAIDAADDDAFYAWAEWYGREENCRVAYTELQNADGYVSTVFLGMDVYFSLGCKPILFETRVFGGPIDGDTWRYPTWAEAEAGHAAVVAICNALKVKEE